MNEDQATHGQPRSTQRKRSITFGLSEEVIVALETHLGGLNRSAYLERLLRERPEIKQHLKQQR